MRTYNHVTNTSNHAHTGMKVRMGQNGAVDNPVTSWSAQLFKETGLLQQRLSVVLPSLLG